MTDDDTGQHAGLMCPTQLYAIALEGVHEHRAALSFAMSMKTLGLPYSTL